MRFHVISIFPEMVKNYCEESILKRAKEKGLVEFYFYNLRDYTLDKHKRVDDKPYGGGPGMVMNAEPILRCVSAITFPPTPFQKGEIVQKGNSPREQKRKFKTIIFAPDAPKWDNSEAKKYSKKYTDVILICGRYEGIDKRVEKILKATRVSVGDFVLTGGEVPAMILIDTISRQIKGVLGDYNSLEENRTDVMGAKITKRVDEFYTRPEVLEWKSKKHKVPKVFLSGNPKLINEYRNGGLC
jgi:tRNA (guanine37-N1)-methyltransferase